MEERSRGAATKVAERTIAETAVEAADLKTLVKALEKAGLVDTFSGKGPFTVFAPSDKAFSALPKEKLEALFRKPEELKSVLQYHVLRGRSPASEIARMRSAKALNGRELRIRKSGTDVMINESRVTKANIACSNGVIHVIDAVLVPPEK